MNYQKIINLLDNTTSQSSKFRTRNWVGINDELRGKYDNSNIKFKMSMIKSNFCDYSDTYIPVKGTMIVPNMATAVNNTNKKVIFKNCATFSNCITEVNNTKVDDAENIDIVISLYNLIEYSDAYSKTSRSLWQYYRDEPVLDNNNNIIDFRAKNISFNFKQQIKGETGNRGTKDVEIMVTLKYLSNFWRTLQMLLINYEI